MQTTRTALPSGMHSGSALMTSHEPPGRSGAIHAPRHRQRHQTRKRYPYGVRTGCCATPGLYGGRYQIRQIQKVEGMVRGGNWHHIGMYGTEKKRGIGVSIPNLQSPRPEGFG